MIVVKEKKNLSNRSFWSVWKTIGEKKQRMFYMRG